MSWVSPPAPSHSKTCRTSPRSCIKYLFTSFWLANIYNSLTGWCWIPLQAASDANWTEYEMDHILFARGEVPLDNVNQNEVEQVEFIARENLPTLLNDSTRKLSPWFHLIGSNLLPHWWDNLDSVLEKDNSDRQIHDYR
ncbi:unnamed protein product [Phytophthora lilii]|uniref:Unnamed protein product n=1 Tax=Phytophthora lilii TaxID=2077276 RepID=A0A9W6WY49_9STRA|nr:unnamed protein product [Phytophthora lilii]